MLRFTGNVLFGVLVFILVTASLLFRLTTWSIPHRQEGESQQELLARLWKAYRAMWRVVLASPWFWGAAGLVTAALVFFNWQALH